MANGTPINLVVEDELGEQMIRVLLCPKRTLFSNRSGLWKAWKRLLKKDIAGVSTTRQRAYRILFSPISMPEPCATFLIEDWFNCPIAEYPKRRRNGNLLFRIAVHEVESWIMADRSPSPNFLAFRFIKFQLQTDDIPDPKKFLIRFSAIEPEKRSSRRFSSSSG